MKIYRARYHHSWEQRRFRYHYHERPDDKPLDGLVRDCSFDCSCGFSDIRWAQMGAHFQKHAPDFPESESVFYTVKLAVQKVWKQDREKIEHLYRTEKERTEREHD